MNVIPKLMRGVQLTGHGGPEMLNFRTDIPVPAPGPGDVLVRVLAAGVNNTDINTRVGWYSKGDGDSADASWAGDALQFPRIQGIDVCGQIAAVGDGVTKLRVGERVLIEPCLTEWHGQALEKPWFLGSECDGGFAEYVSVASRHAFHIQSDLGDAALASFPCSYSTAENMLTRATVSAQDCVLITGASGGVGSAAIQLAKARGCRVIAMTSPAHMDGLLDLGADVAVDRNDDVVNRLSGDSVTVVVDLVAGPQWPKLLDVLCPRGRYVVAGAVGGPLVDLDVRTLYLKDLSLLGCTILDDGVFANLVSHIASGRIRPVVAQTWDLADIEQAQRAFGQKGYVGKIVLKVAADAT